MVASLADSIALILATHLGRLGIIAGGDSLGDVASSESLTAPTSINTMAMGTLANLSSTATPLLSVGNEVVVSITTVVVVTGSPSSSANGSRPVFATLSTAPASTPVNGSVTAKVTTKPHEPTVLGTASLSSSSSSAGAGAGAAADAAGWRISKVFGTIILEAAAALLAL